MPADIRLQAESIVNGTAPSRSFGENFRVGAFGSFVVRQFVRPRHTTASVGASTRTTPFGIERRFFAGRVAPVVPSFGANRGRKFTTHPNGASSRFPRASEIEFCHLRVGRDLRQSRNTYPYLLRSVVDAAVMKLSDLAWIWQSSKTTIDGPKMKSVVPSM